MEKNKRLDLLAGDIVPSLIKMALPLMALNFINTAYSIADTYWIGKMGELKVGAISLISPITNCCSAFSTGLCASGMALMSRQMGSGNKEQANRIATLLVEISLGLGLIFGLVTVFFANPILNFLATPQDIYQDSYLYMMGLAADYTFLFIISLFQSVRQSCGDSKTGVYINLACSIINVALDPLFIFTFNMGIFGAALATTLSKGLMMPVIFYLLIRNDSRFIGISFKKYRFNLQLFFDVIKIALPASISSFISSFGFLIMNKQITSYGSIVLSGYGMGNKICNIFYIPLNSISGALTPFIGYAIGMKDYDRMHLCYKRANQIALILSAIFTVVGFLLMKPATLFFVKNASEQYLYETCHYGYYSIATIFLMGWFNNIAALFNGTGNTRTNLIINTFRLWGLRIPLVLLFAKITTWNQTGIWIAMILSNIGVCLLGEGIYRFTFFKKYPKKSTI